MFKQAVKSELCQISLTGMRSLLLLGLLIQAPRSLEEIREAFIKFNVMEDSNSYDILRIDLNTLRAMGCDISRSSRKTNFKYVLNKHPFSLIISKDEFEVLKKAFKRVKNISDIRTLIEYDELFRKIANHVSDDEIKEALIGLCSMKSQNLDKIKELDECCHENNVVTIVYKSPASKSQEQMDIAAEKLVFKNDKIYLYGFDINKKKSVALHVKRILSLLSKKDNDENYISEKVTVTFILKDFTIAGLENEEKIIEKTDEGYLIEGSYHNEFIATQRILSFGSSCKVLSPEDFKTKIIEILRKIKEIYSD